MVYAESDLQKQIELNLEDEVSLFDAVQKSHITDFFPDLDLEHCDFGIFGKTSPKNQLLADGDRVEIYRPLLCNPAEMRKMRAKRNRSV